MKNNSQSSIKLDKYELKKKAVKEEIKIEEEAKFCAICLETSIKIY